MALMFEKITKFLQQNTIEFASLSHDHVHTSFDAAKTRGTKLEQAAKAIVLKDKKSKQFYLFVVGGDRKLDLKKIKKEILGVKNLSLAPVDEVLEVTGCKVGTVPPFGNLFNIPVYFSKHLFETQGEIVFSAGTHFDSIKMKTKDFVNVVKPIIEEYSIPITN